MALHEAIFYLVDFLSFCFFAAYEQSGTYVIFRDDSHKFGLKRKIEVHSV